jgi:hypothetical protein
LRCYRDADFAAFNGTSAGGGPIEPSSHNGGKAALAVARPFGAHLGFLHICIDAATFAATIMPEVSSGHVLSDMINRMEEETQGREQKAKQLFETFCRREGLVVVETPSMQSERSARWLRENGSESYWLAEYARTADLLVIGRPDDDR